MAAADIDYVAYGIIVGGTGTDNTTVFTDLKQIKMMRFAGNADGATCVIKTKDPSGAWVTVEKFASTDTGELGGIEAKYGENGAPFNGMQVTLGHASDLLFIHVV